MGADHDLDRAAVILGAEGHEVFIKFGVMAADRLQDRDRRAGCRARLRERGKARHAECGEPQIGDAGDTGQGQHVPENMHDGQTFGL